MLRELEKYFKTLQNDVCDKIEKCSKFGSFLSDDWSRKTDSHIKEGGGITRVLKNSAIFEQAGVNFSFVSGELPETMTKTLLGETGKAPFVATGVSMVIHPHSPLIPTTHANVRYLEVADQKWFGGGMDLTPYYVVDEDVRLFHQKLKDVCDRHNPDYYAKFKEHCDRYFYLPHRKEARGVGGIFFDYLGKDNSEDLNSVCAFVKDFGNTFIDIYLPMVEKYKEQEWTKQQKDFQLIRRGRYVEFNLLFDRGTKFGIETDGRAESILMSLPPNVRWEYDYEPEAESEEARTLQILRNPIDWL